MIMITLFAYCKQVDKRTKFLTQIEFLILLDTVINMIIFDTVTSGQKNTISNCLNF